MRWDSTSCPPPVYLKVSAAPCGGGSVASISSLPTHLVVLMRGGPVKASYKTRDCAWAGRYVEEMDVTAIAREHTNNTATKVRIVAPLPFLTFNPVPLKCPVFV